jgi:hypothetical protein
MEGAARTYLAEILIAGGDYVGAEREAAAAIATLAGAPSLQVAALGVSSRARLGRGDVEGALEAGRAAHEALERLGGSRKGSRWCGSRSRRRSTGRARRRTPRARRTSACSRAERIEEPAWRTASCTPSPSMRASSRSRRNGAPRRSAPAPAPARRHRRRRTRTGARRSRAPRRTPTGSNAQA